MAEYKISAYRDWPNCAYVQHGDLELIVTLDVGPRVISCRLNGGANLFKEFAEELGCMRADKYMLFGGHRLWHAPEEQPRSYSPDFDPVSNDWRDSVLRLVQKTEPTTGVQKAIDLHFEEGGRVRLQHRLTNTNLWSVELAAWSATLLAPGTRAIVPQEDFRPHPEHLYPARTLTLWHYTRMGDPRVRWGDRFIELREDSNVDYKIKFGLLNKQRWAASWNHGVLFIKTFGFRDGLRYADLGCNFEAFTMPGFLELESLGPLQVLEPKATLSHEEIWHCWPCPVLPEDEEALQAALQPYLAQLVFPGG